MIESGDSAANLENFIDRILSAMDLSPANDYAVSQDNLMNYYYKNGGKYKKAVWKKGESEWELAGEEDIAESDVREAVISSKSF